MNRRTLLKSASVAVLVTLLTACGGDTFIRSFRVALASSGPLVSSLVASGAIPENKTNAIIADFDSGAQCGLTLQQDFAAIAKDATETKSLKLNASVKAFRCFRAVIEHQNFALHPRLQQVASIADGVLASLVVFYSDGGEMRASTLPTATISARTEQDLERQMKSQMEALEKAMKP